MLPEMARRGNKRASVSIKSPVKPHFDDKLEEVKSDSKSLHNEAKVVVYDELIPDCSYYRAIYDSRLYTIKQVETEAQEPTSANFPGMMPPASPIVAAKKWHIKDKLALQHGKEHEIMKKVPGEVFESTHQLVINSFGPNRCTAHFIQLRYLPLFAIQKTIEKQDNKETKYLDRIGPVCVRSRSLSEADEEAECDVYAIEEVGRFYYRVLIPIEPRRHPDILSSALSTHMMKNAEDIIECNRTFQYPLMSTVFIKPAYEDGWLFDRFSTGAKILERLEKNPDIEYGDFYYLVRIPVGIRVAPNILAQRANCKGFKLNSIVEASQRFTPPGSKITYVRLKRGRQRQSRNASSETLQSEESEGNEQAYYPLDQQAHVQANLMRHGGWIFETTMDGKLVLERIEPPISRSVERLFYRVLEDTDVLLSPILTHTAACTSPLAKHSTKRKRLKGTLVECTERIVPSSGTLASSASRLQLAFLKLRHDSGWICERQLDPPHRIVVEQVQGYAVTTDDPRMYRILISVHLRSAPDYDSSRLPGASPLAVGTILRSSLHYTPPGSRITYIKIANECQLYQDPTIAQPAAPSVSGTSSSGWIFTHLSTGEAILEEIVDSASHRTGDQYFRVLVENKNVTLFPDSNSEVIDQLEFGTIFAAEMEYTLLKSNQPYLKIMKPLGWIQADGAASDCTDPMTLDASYSSQSKTSFNIKSATRTLERVSKELYTLYTSPPSWVRIGYPQQRWFKVADDTSRTAIIEEMLLQSGIFKSRNTLASSSQGRDNVPISRRGYVRLSVILNEESEVPVPVDAHAANEEQSDSNQMLCEVTLEEITHSASALLFTFPWKQLWWIFRITEQVTHCVELQHGIRGGYRAVYYDGELVHENRSVSDFLWDTGSEFEFEAEGRTFKTIIALQGAFLSQYMQFYTYSLLVNEEEIVSEQYVYR